MTALTPVPCRLSYQVQPTMKPSNIPEQTSTTILSAELQQLVRGLLRNHLRSFSVELSDDGIVLSGYCDSFHAKQMAQEIVAKSTSRRIVSNDLVVGQPNNKDT